MNISAPFILRPVATGLLMTAVVLLGLLGYSALPISSVSGSRAVKPNAWKAGYWSKA